MDKITIKEISDELGLSMTTVSRALSGKGRCSEKTRELVNGYVESTGKVPNRRTEPSKNKKSYGILVTIPGEKDYGTLPYFSEVLVNVYDYFEPLGYHVIIAKTSVDDISSLEKIVKKHKCDGVILSRTIENAKDIHFLKENRVPFVVIGSYADHEVYQIDVDQKSACRKLTSYLLDKDYRNIALFCADWTHVVTQNRYQGFIKAFDDKGIDVNQNLIFTETGYSDVAECYTEKMLKEGIECIVCMDDNICINVLNALRKYGARIPDDMAVVSLYNSQMLDDYYKSITTVNFNISELASKAAEKLYCILKGEEVRRWEYLGFEILYRNSTR